MRFASGKVNWFLLQHAVNVVPVVVMSKSMFLQ
jgi:hypothetical protein